MKNVFRFSALAAAFLAAAAAFAQAASALVTAEANGITLSIVIKGDLAEITVSAKTTGWVAVGFDPVAMMQGADIKIGYVKDGKAYGRDDTGASPISHKSDESMGGTSDFVSVTGTEKDGVTTMVFTVPRLSKDKLDKPLTAGKHSVILAYGSADDFTTKHVAKGKAEITLP
jgi:hypothetical protein